MIPKPGYKTTEFWVTTLTSLGALIAALSSHLTPKYAALGAAVSSGVYAVSRGLTKLGALTAQPTVTTQPAQPAPPVTGPTQV